ncbi:MAG: hypothetical protein IK104_04670 [Clostridia bacterium]|nr:hypothetical protein [Clostridia bacterium]
MSGTRKLRTAAAVVLLLAFLLGLGSACGKSDVVAFYFAVDPGRGSTFDPQIAGAGAISVAVRNIYEGLVYLDERGNPEPGVAESWNISDDGLTYTFHLREGAKWHLTATASEELGDKLKDFSDDVTAYDFVFALRRAVDPATGAPDAKLLENVFFAKKIAAGERSPETLGVFAENAHTLRIRLEKPQSDFLEVLTRPVCMPCPKAFFEATGGRYGLYIKYIVSNGPFYLTRFDLDEGSYRLAKSPDYVGDHTAKADVIWLYHRPDDETLKEKLSDGTYTGALVDEGYAEKNPLKGGSSVTCPDILRAFVFNAAGKAAVNKDVRKAFCGAAALEVLCAECGKTETKSMLPAAFDGVGATYTYPDSITEAREQLRRGLEALEADTAELSILCEARFENALRKLLQEYQKTLGIGMAVSVAVVEKEDLVSRVAAGNFEVAFYPLQAPAFGLSRWFAQFSAASPKSVCRFDDASFDAAVENLRYNADGADDARALARTVGANALMLPVWQENSVFLLAKNVSGVRLLPGKDAIYFFDAK